MMARWVKHKHQFDTYVPESIRDLIVSELGRYFGCYMDLTGECPSSGLRLV